MHRPDGEEMGSAMNTHPFIEEFESGKVACQLGEDMYGYAEVWISVSGSRQGTAALFSKSKNHNRDTEIFFSL